MRCIDDKLIILYNDKTKLSQTFAGFYAKEDFFDDKGTNLFVAEEVLEKQYRVICCHLHYSYYLSADDGNDVFTMEKV